MTARPPQASLTTPPDPPSAILPALIAVVCSLNRPPHASWSQVAAYCQDCVRVGVSGHALAQLIETMAANGMLDDATQ